jgi:Dyggve-Melchior-Clausen syndrome protein
MVESEDKQSILQERYLMEDLLNNLIVLLDTLVYRTLPKNPELVYSILHQQSMLLRLAGEMERGKHLKNVGKVVQHFNTCVDTARQSLIGSGNHGDEWSVAQVMGVIQHELLSWKKSYLYDVEDMHCTYEEAPRACDFFLPYVWSTMIESPSSQYFPLPSTRFVCNGALGSSTRPVIVWVVYTPRIHNLLRTALSSSGMFLKQTAYSL